MLEKLRIKNIALIEEAEITFGERLNVLSGETGSGKSVILDSINFVLGSKADKSMIRYGADEAMVRAEFSVPEDCVANSVLKEFDIEADENIVISRKFTKDGKSSIKINGNAVTAAMLKSVASHLVDVHGQSEHFFLLSESNQLSLIDSLSGDKLSSLKARLSGLLEEKNKLKNRIKQLGGSEQERAVRLDILSYQINEIKNADINKGEYDSLCEKKRLIDNSEKIITSINSVKRILSDDGGCVDLLSAANRQISSISDYGEDYEALAGRLDNLYIETQDLSETLSDLAENFNFDEEEARYVESRLDLLKGLFKKYGSDEEQVLAFLEGAEEQYAALNDAANELENIDGKFKELDKELFSVCKELTKIRRLTSEKLCKNVEEELKSLNIPNAKFFVEFKDYDQSDIKNIGTSGADEICFMFSANKGEPPKRLNKVISGGEMSRFMLAIKTQLKNINGISTYIFDEIDAGISGLTAKSVAEKFIAISKDTQIIAVSHLPQVCAAAENQYLISKSDRESKTLTQVKLLTREERIGEIIRLTGSVATQAARVHAEELLKQFNN